MISDRERRQADRFYADLMGLANPALPEETDGWPDLRNGRVVFYDEDTLRFIEGWTRATGTDEAILINRGAFDPIRANGRSRSREFDRFLAQTKFGGPALMPPLFVIDSSLHTVPLARNAPGHWDDLMISRLMAAGRRVTVQPEDEQWKVIRQMFDKAMQAAQSTGRSQPPQEFVAYFVLNTSQATLMLVQASNVTMSGAHANIPLAHAQIGTRRFPILPGTNAAERVIGNIHTHAYIDFLIDTSSTATGTRIGTNLVHGVSDVDVESAKTERFPVYAIDSRFLHRANPDGSKQDQLPQSGNLLRETLRQSGGEPA